MPLATSISLRPDSVARARAQFLPCQRVGQYGHQHKRQQLCAKSQVKSTVTTHAPANEPAKPAPAAGSMVRHRISTRRLYCQVAMPVPQTEALLLTPNRVAGWVGEGGEQCRHQNQAAAAHDRIHETGQQRRQRDNSQFHEVIVAANKKGAGIAGALHNNIR
jgi:hypothetical protein